MQSELYKRGQRLVSIVVPETFEEWKDAVSQGFAVATTREQREEWGLGPTDDIPILPSSEVVELVFLAPGDDMFGDGDPEYNTLNSEGPIEEEFGEVVLGPDGEYYKLTEDGELEYDSEGNPVLDERFHGGRRLPRPGFSPESSV